MMCLCSNAMTRSRWSTRRFRCQTVVLACKGTNKFPFQTTIVVITVVLRSLLAFCGLFMPRFASVSPLSMKRRRRTCIRGTDAYSLGNGRRNAVYRCRCGYASGSYCCSIKNDWERHKCGTRRKLFVIVLVDKLPSWRHLNYEVATHGGTIRAAAHATHARGLHEQFLRA